MNMMDGEETFHPTREGFNHLSDLEWSEVERISSTVGETVISVMLESLDRDQQHAAIARFIQNELIAEREKVESLASPARLSTDRAVETAAISC